MARGKYEEWLSEENLTRIESWASDGLSNEQIASNMGIAPETLSRWVTKYDQFNQALKKGRAPVVRELENSLMKKAMGFEYEETTVESWVDDNGKTRKKATKRKLYSPPDTSAAIFLLKNYKPNKYRNYSDLTKRQIEADIIKVKAETEKIRADMTVNEYQNEKITELVEKMDVFLDD